MKFIDISSLNDRENAIREDFHSKKPFRYTTIESLLNQDRLKEILDSYPAIKDGLWDGRTYIDQNNKFQKNTFDPDSIFNEIFDELNSGPFLQWLQRITGIQNLVADSELFGGGLHQSITGAFLNVHVDYNVHPKTKFHRRLNVLIYLNDDWREEYEGCLELWDFTGEKKLLLDRIAPTLNRCVIFETNEISFHGHPKPLRTPPDINRKSIATYYYTATRPESEVAPEHNTIYINTEGSAGQAKRFLSGIKAFVERMF
jgi:Rps23 Pro-64 3,4-dihydroxylase Tpa1-like proline 4-hydroxylase